MLWVCVCMYFSGSFACIYIYVYGYMNVVYMCVCDAGGPNKTDAAKENNLKTLVNYWSTCTHYNTIIFQHLLYFFYIFKLFNFRFSVSRFFFLSPYFTAFLPLCLFNVNIFPAKSAFYNHIISCLSMYIVQ